MITIKQWFRTKAIIPLMTLTGLVISIWLVYLVNQFIELKDRQINQIEQQANLMQLPITRNDRVILETLIGSYYLNTKASSIAICRDQRPYMTLGWKNNFCKSRPGNFLHRIVSGKIGGLKGYELVADVPIFNSNSFWLFVLPGGLLVIACVFIVQSLRTDLKRNILLPLQSCTGSNDVKIKEVKDLLDKQELAKQTEIFKATYKIAKQVAHDIRSPLSCMETVAKMSKSLKDDEMKLIIKSVQRINEVAEGLLLTDRHQKQSHFADPKDMALSNSMAAQSKLDNVNVAQLLKECVDYKCIEHSANKNLKISTIIERNVSDLHLNLDPKAFKRVLSNLINNSVEAIPKNAKGFILTNLSRVDNQIFLEIRDNGKGIAPDNLSKIVNSGVSIGKENGNGLGLTYARQIVSGLSGELNIYSKLGMGTTIRITLPPTS